MEESTEITNSNKVRGPSQKENDKQQNSSIPEKTVTKPPKLEDKPFQDFISEDFIPTLTKSLEGFGQKPISLLLIQDQRPVVGGQCWMVSGEISAGRRFWLCFSEKKISSSKTFALAEPGTDPSLLESFLIDEKKTTLALLVSRILQRLNGQKWLGPN